jgi:hypothetical protein
MRRSSRGKFEKGLILWLFWFLVGYLVIFLRIGERDIKEN